MDCPEWFGTNQSNDCYNTYELNECCSTGKFCETPTNVSHKCKLNDIVVKEGERLWFGDECTQCICTPDYDRNDSKHCKRMQCGISLNFYKHAHQFCAPVYITYVKESKALCCPTEFICRKLDTIN